MRIYGSSMVLTAKEELPVKDLLNLMLISSSCDAAFTLSFNFGKKLQSLNLDA